MDTAHCQSTTHDNARTPKTTSFPPSSSTNMTDMYDEKKVPEFALPPYQHEDHGASVSRQDGSAANVGCVKKCQEDSGARALNSSGCSR